MGEGDEEAAEANILGELLAATCQQRKKTIHRIGLRP
jgi:hypothetical protein